jgi:hypothetical protein
MQGIYTHFPETNCVPREYIVAAILSLLFMVLQSLVPALDLLYLYVSTFRSMCAVLIMAVFCSLLLLLLLLIITFMQCIYNHIPESNHVSRGYYVAALTQLQFVVYVIISLLNVFYSYISTFEVCVPCPI